MEKSEHGLLHEIKTVDTRPEAVRSFGFTVGTVLLTLGVVLWLYGGEVGVTEYILGGFGGVLVLLGWGIPVVLTPLYRVWMALALVLGFVMNRVLLTVVFFGLVTPIGLLARVVRGDPLERVPEPEVETYWKPTEEERGTRRLEQYY